MPPIESRVGAMRLGVTRLGYPPQPVPYYFRLNRLVLGHGRLGVPEARPVLAVSASSITFPPRVNTDTATVILTLTNTGAAPLTITSLALTGPDATAFFLSSACGGTLAAGASCDVTITYGVIILGSPGVVQTFTAALVITVPFPAQSITVPLSGSMFLPIVYSPLTLSFAPQRIGTTTALAVAVTNTGPFTETLPTYSITGPDAAKFAILTSLSGATLGPGASAVMLLTFASASLGTFVAALTASRTGFFFPFTVTTEDVVALTGVAVPDLGKPLPMTIALGGVNHTTEGRVEGISIDHYLNAQPDTMTLRVVNLVPVKGQDLKLYLGGTSPADLIFGGTVEQLTKLHEGPATRVAFDLEAVDYTPRLRRRTVTARYPAQSASDTITNLVSRFASGITTIHVIGALPICGPFTFTDAQLPDVLDEILTAIGGYWYLDFALDLHAFLTDTTAADPITDAAPAGMITIREAIDLSQVRTRIWVLGRATTATREVDAGATSIPIADGAGFSATGGLARTPSQRVTYTGLQHVDKRGTLSVGVGGAYPSGGGQAATPANTYDGALGVGVYSYRVTAESALGETVGSPAFTAGIAAFLSSPVGPPTASQIAGTPGGLRAGDYRYHVTFENANGETARSGSSETAARNISRVTAPGTGPTLAAGGAVGSMAPGTYKYVVTYLDAVGETTAGTLSQITIAAPNTGVTLTAIPTSADARVTKRRLYRTFAGGSTYFLIEEIGDNTTTTRTDVFHDTGLFTTSPPGTNTSGTGQMALTAIPIGPTGTIARHLYRTEVDVAPTALTLKKVATLSDNTTTIYTDTTADGSLGDLIPAVSSADGGQITVTVPTGPAGTTARHLYRTVANGSVHRQLATLSNNTTTTFVDNVADDALGDELGPGTIVAQPGDTSLAVQSVAPFAGAGWVRAGSQVIRYGGLAGAALVGIPASGSGSILNPISVGTAVDGEPHLTGVTGLVGALPVGEAVRVLVMREDAAAIAALIALSLAGGTTGDDGIREDVVDAGDAGIAECTARGDATLLERKDPLATLSYTTRNPTVQVGRLQVVTLTQPPIVGSYRIQHVHWSELGQPNQLWPLRTVTASSRRFSFADLLRRLGKG